MEVDFKISNDDLLDFHIKHIHETKVYKQQIRLYTIYYFNNRNRCNTSI